MKCSIQKIQIETSMHEWLNLNSFSGSPILTSWVKVEINEASWSDESHWECLILRGTQTVWIKKRKGGK